jgi:hypothetical protein
MASLRQDSRGNFVSRRKLPTDVRDEYGRQFGQRHEAKLTPWQLFELWVKERNPQREQSKIGAATKWGIEGFVESLDRRLKSPRDDAVPHLPTTHSGS